MFLQKTLHKHIQYYWQWLMKEKTFLKNMLKIMISELKWNIVEYVSEKTWNDSLLFYMWLKMTQSI